MERESEILSANKRDLAVASSLSAPLFSRLQLTPKILRSLADGLLQLAREVVEDDLVGSVVRRVLVGEELELVQQRVPIGVLLVIFESRPDCLPQARTPASCIQCLIVYTVVSVDSFAV